MFSAQSKKFTWLLGAAMMVSATFGASEARAQDDEPTLDERCPIPFTVERKQTLVQAYVELTNKIGTALPLDLPPGALEAYYTNVRSLIAGEALQSLAQLRAAYVCRLKAELPENKHKHIDLLAREVGRASSIAFLNGNFASREDLAATYEFFDGLIESPPAALTRIPVANRVTSDEILAVLGNPNFQLRSETRMGIEANFGVVRGGVCKGVVRATLAALDNATISALAAHGKVMADFADDDMRAVSYDQLVTDGQSIYYPGALTQIGAQLNAPGTAREEMRSCLLEGSEAQTVILNQNVDISTDTEDDEGDDAVIDSPDTDEQQ